MAGFRRFSSLAALICVFSSLGCDQRSAAVPEASAIQELVVITPHAEAIRDAFAQRFSLWFEREHKKTVSIRWIPRSTVEAQRFIIDQFSRVERGSGGIGVDVFFGGGLPIHREIVARGLAQPIQVPADILAGIPRELHGQPLYAEDGSWYGSALSGFGILYNKPACRMRGLPIPQTWTDLASPVYRGWVAAADPALSGSTAECLTLILLKHGWEEGWGIATGILANCNGLSPSSSHVAPNVASGIAAAGLQVEFVARAAVAAAPDILDYASPPSATAISPDPVTVLRNPPHLETAAQFVAFVLSPEGQALWAVQPEEGGPEVGPLYRYPIRPDIYEKFGDRLVVTGNPFRQSTDFRIDPEAERAYTQLLPHLLKAACGPNHLYLQQAWAAATAEGPDSPRLAKLKAPPFSREEAFRFAQECASSPQRAAELQEEWTRFFAARYREHIPDTQAEGISSTARP